MRIKLNRFFRVIVIFFLAFPFVSCEKKTLEPSNPPEPSNPSESSKPNNLNGDKHEIKFKNNENSETGSNYISPIIYLINGKKPHILLINKGTSNNKDNSFTKPQMSPFSAIKFTLPADINRSNLKTQALTKSEFCQNLKVVITNDNLISFQEQNSYSKLKTFTSCSFKIISSENNLADNKLTLIFNYTVDDWASNLGDGTEAQKTAKVLSLSNNIYSLYNLDLKRKNIIDISPLSFLVHIKELELSENTINYIPDFIFKELHYLEILDLARNKLIAFSDNSLRGLINLNTLYLNYNNISDITTNFEGLIKLETLYLSGNHIKSIHKNSFSHLINLRNLYLDNNQIGSIPDYAFNGLTNLTNLYLRNNKIKNISENGFQGLTSLRHLYLNSNEISVFPKSVHDQLKNLPTLNTDNNPGHPNFGN